MEYLIEHAAGGAALNWVDEPFNAANFSSSVHWNILAGDIKTNSYVLSGNFMLWNFFVLDTDAVGLLQIKFPAGKTSLQFLHTINGFSSDVDGETVLDLNVFNAVDHIVIGKAVISNDPNSSEFINIGAGVQIGFQIALKVN
jgi:hypothetical protein